MNDAGTEAAGPFSDYSNNTSYTYELCLEPGCYIVWMVDSYGDGWQGAILTIYNEYDEVLASGYVPASPGDEATMSLPLSEDCPISGCLLEEAFNYNPLANQDDGSCVRQSDNVELLGIWNDSTIPINGFGG